MLHKILRRIDFNILNLITFSSSIGAVKDEIIEIGAENRQSALASVRFKRGINNGCDEFLFVNNESDRTGATEDGNTYQQSVALTGMILLLLVQQHLYGNQINQI